MWLAFKMSGTDGFSCLESGQVRFSIRDVELEFGVSFWMARGWIERAKAENLLKPTASFRRSKGSGEIYATDGPLLKTRRSTTDQQPINNRSTKPKKTGDLDGRIDQQPTNNRPTTDRLIDKTKKDQEDQEDRKSSTSPLEPYVLLWNSTLHPLGYGKCEKITPKRIAALSARLRQDPEYFTTFSRAVDYLSRDEWWRGKAKQFTIDLLIDQAGRAQELSEKTPSAPSVKSYNSRTADIDEVFIKQMQALGYN